MDDLDRRAVDALTAGAEPAHLEYEQLEASVDGRADLVDREIVESHTAICAACARELRDLREFRQSLLPSESRRHWYAAAVAAMLLLVAGFAIFVNQSRPVVRVHDSGRDVAVLGDGRVVGLGDLSGEERREVAGALTRNELPMPAALSKLRSHGPQQLLGTPSAESPLAPLAPLRSVSVSDRPSFAWTPVEGARYKVEVFDEHYRPVAESPSLSDPRWTIDAPLPRGNIYAWQVTAVTPSRSITAPAPPQPEARFEVLDAARTEQIRRLQRQQPPSHLALGIAFAHAGATAEAEQELQALVAENRDSAAARRLLQTVQAWSR